MSTYTEVDEKELSLTDMPDELLKKVRRSVGLLGSPDSDLFHEQTGEKRSRREIANCNERRRMQSINSGFESLKTLLPTDDGEKLSKAAILQLTSKYIQHLVGENRRMRDQLSQLQQQQQQRHADLMLAASDGASRKRKLGDSGGVGGGGGGGVYIGYFQQQDSSANRPQPQQQPTFQLAVKPDYEQFVIEPAAQPSQPAKPKRLEHLMMAIERIEGRSQSSYPQSASPDDSAADSECDGSGGDRQRQLLESAPAAADPVTAAAQQQQPAIMISPFTPHGEHSGPPGCSDASSDATASRLVVVDLVAEDAGGQLCRPRAIPHKYLHRPQVVQANRSN